MQGSSQFPDAGDSFTIPKGSVESTLPSPQIPYDQDLLAPQRSVIQELEAINDLTMRMPQNTSKLKDEASMLYSMDIRFRYTERCLSEEKGSKQMPQRQEIGVRKVKRKNVLEEMPNRHKLPENLKPQAKKFSYSQKPNWLEIRQHQKRKLVAKQKRKTINDVKVDPREVASIYQLIDDTKQRMKQIKEGVKLPKEIKKPVPAKLNKTEDNIIIEQGKDRDQKMPEIISTSKRSTAHHTLKSSYQGGAKLLSSMGQKTIIEEASSGGYYSSGYQRKTATRQPSQDSLVKFKTDDEKSGVPRRTSSIKYDIISPRATNRAKVTFSPDTDVRTRRSQNLAGSALGSVQQQRRILKQSRDRTPSVDRSPTKSPSIRKRDSVCSHLEQDLPYSGLSNLRTTAATRFMIDSAGGQGSKESSPSKPQTAMMPPIEKARISPMAETQPPRKAAKWATSQFQIFVHDTKLAHFQQEKDLIKKQWLDEPAYTGEIAEEDKTEEEQATGEFVKNFAKDPDVNHIGLPVKKKKYDEYGGSIRKGAIFKQENLVKTISAFAKSTEKLEALACRGIKNLKNRKEDPLLKADVSFKDLIYPNKVDESSLIQKYFSEPSKSPDKMKKFGPGGDSIYSIKRETTPQLIAQSPTPETSSIAEIRKTSIETPAGRDDTPTILEVKGGVGVGLNSSSVISKPQRSHEPMNSSMGQFKLKGMTVQVLARQNNFGFYPTNIGKTLPNELDYRQKQILRRKVGEQVREIKQKVDTDFQKRNLYSGLMDPLQQEVCKDILKRNTVHKRFKMHVPNFMRKEREQMLKDKQAKQAEIQAELETRRNDGVQSERKKKRHNFSMTDDQLKGVRNNFIEFVKSTVTKDLHVGQKRKTKLHERIDPTMKLASELKNKIKDIVIDV